MNNLVDKNGLIKYGVYENPLDYINYKDFRLRMPSGLPAPAFLKNFKFNMFNFIGITGPDIMVGLAVVDLKYVTNGFFYVYDIPNKKLTETKKTAFPNNHTFIDPHPNNVNSAFRSKNLNIKITNNSVYASGANILIDAKLDHDQNMPLRLCTRSGYWGWTYTQKTSPIPISGMIKLNGRDIPISSPAHYAISDWSAGYMRRNTFWNWAAIAGSLPDGRSLGLNLALGTNETGFNENVFWVNDKMTKTGPVNFEFRDNNPKNTWHIKSGDGKVKLTFHPENYRKENIYAIWVISKFMQLMGTFNGELKTDDNELITVKDCPGWAEDHFARW